MNALIVAGAASRYPALPTSLLGDSCACLLFLAGAVSLGIAGYMLFRNPKTQPVRYLRRR